MSQTRPDTLPVGVKSLPDLPEKPPSSLPPQEAFDQQQPILISDPSTVIEISNDAILESQSSTEDDRKQSPLFPEHRRLSAIQTGTHIYPPVSVPNSGTNTPSVSRPETPFGSSEVLAVPPPPPQRGTPTTTVHVTFSSKLGWICWKDTEASLFALFERAFACVRAEMTFSDSLDTFGVSLEVPSIHVAALEKELGRKFLLAEVDRIHGISPALRTPDAKILRITKSLGATVCTDCTPSSIESLNGRVNSLMKCAKSREKEIVAMSDQLKDLEERIRFRTCSLESKISTRPSGLVEVENWLVDRISAELKTIQEW
ncbi:hypothetical protein HDU82_000058 [Entophlyctis luteolus]|nr:hypothetical protein HDU82_000058 [Entophlyctis luteolus]KAJ3394581.1 hypothetical protein HDU84_007755 [Entophlyctis sp. JEL0112]